MSTDLYDRARRTYEWSRWKRALPLSLIAVPAVLLSVSVCAADVWCWTFAGLFAVVLVLCSWRGQAFERAIAPGLVAGCVAFVLPLIGQAIGLCGLASRDLCFAMCVAGGLIAGTFVGSRMLQREGDRLQFLCASCAIAALLGSLGCFVAGIAGVLGMSAGVAITAMPIWVWQRVRA